MTFEDKLNTSQKLLREAQLDGWLLYDFRRSNTLACSFLDIPHDLMLTRRFYYWIPSEGEPVKIVSSVEPHVLDHLPGQRQVFRSWQDLESSLTALLDAPQRIAMEYAPMGSNPYVSMVDGGTLEFVRAQDVDVCSSADFMQQFTCVWTDEQADSHRYAAKVVMAAVDSAWERLAEELAAGRNVDEYTVQQWILEDFQKAGCVNHGDPIVAVNANSADPHYTPSKEQTQPIKPGDFVLIDLWCKQDFPDATYADICRVAVAAADATDEQKKVFDTVKAAQFAALDLVKERFGTGQDIMGWEVDDASRKVIKEAGYGEYFTHRTGHNIHTNDHGPGTHMDNLETQDRRKILPRTSFSIEPGIYLPGNFGVRLETDVYIREDLTVEVTGGLQEELIYLLKEQVTS